MQPNSPKAWAAARQPDAMPQTRAFVKAMRELLGEEHVDALIRAARDGRPTFHAKENGIELGVPHQNDDKAFARRACTTCQGWARPGASEGYCGAGRADLAPAYGAHHPLRKLPADGGTGCEIWSPAC